MLSDVTSIVSWRARPRSFVALNTHAIAIRRKTRVACVGVETRNAAESSPELVVARRQHDLAIRGLKRLVRSDGRMCVAMPLWRRVLRLPLMVARHHAIGVSWGAALRLALVTVRS